MPQRGDRLRERDAPAWRRVRWAWLVCAAVLVVHGLTVTARSVPRAAPGSFTGPMASSDHMLAFLLMPHGSQPAMEALSGVPENEAVLFVGRRNAESYAQTYYGIASVALPRMVADLRCGDAGEAQLPFRDPGVPYGGVVLYEPARPIGDPHAVKVGARLVVIRGRPRADLRSYCSAVVPGTDPGWTAP